MLPKFFDITHKPESFTSFFAFFSQQLIVSEQRAVCFLSFSAFLLTLSFKLLLQSISVFLKLRNLPSQIIKLISNYTVRFKSLHQIRFLFELSD